MTDIHPSWFNQPTGIFPLPNVVLFPGVILPLQIFEPRYRAMIEDALAGEAIIATALLRPGYEALYFTNHAEIYPVVGVGQIREHVKSMDGRYFISLIGMCRARIMTEYNEGEYRTALLEPILQKDSGIDKDGEFAARLSFRKLLNASVFDNIERINTCRKLLNNGISLSETIDKIASALLPAGSIQIQQCMLEEADVLRRAKILLNELHIVRQTLELIQKNLNNWPHLGSTN
ncbi:MAG: LON peptidase substrate-binding domain-containing protein [Planctomycetota bacterium]|nr:MAG: LON peptidase substrate-binding domain-containing protein [Planctomycetota bacterium]